MILLTPFLDCIRSNGGTASTHADLYHKVTGNLKVLNACYV